MSVPELQCKIHHGMSELRNDLEGSTILFVRQAFGAMLNIPMHAQAVVNGLPVDDAHVLKAADEVVFVNASGVKGLGRLYSPDELQAIWEINATQYQELLRKGLPTCTFQDGTVRHPEIAVDEWLRHHFRPPELLTEEEAIRHLRLDTINIANPADTLRRYRDKGLLRATQVSKKLFYRRSELDEFLGKLTTGNPR